MVKARLAEVGIRVRVEALPSAAFFDSHDRGGLLLARGVSYEPRADGYLRLADLRPDAAPSR